VKYAGLNNQFGTCLNVYQGYSEGYDIHVRWKILHHEILTGKYMTLA